MPLGLSDKPTLEVVLSIEQMSVPNESRIGRAIGFAIIVIAIFVVGWIWRPDNSVQGQVGAQEDGIGAGSGATGGQQAATPG
jgi:hypothetical protein